jgi:hypothetical protein
MQRGSDRTDIGKKGAFSARFRPTGRMNRGPGRHRKIIGPVAGGSTSAPTKASRAGPATFYSRGAQKPCGGRRSAKSP